VLPHGYATETVNSVITQDNPRATHSHRCPLIIDELPSFSIVCSRARGWFARNSCSLLVTFEWRIASLREGSPSPISDERPRSRCGLRFFARERFRAWAQAPALIAVPREVWVSSWRTASSSGEARPASSATSRPLGLATRTLETRRAASRTSSSSGTTRAGRRHPRTPALTTASCLASRMATRCPTVRSFRRDRNDKQVRSDKTVHSASTSKAPNLIA
jgi:hypothetical protein